MSRPLTYRPLSTRRSIPISKKCGKKRFRTQIDAIAALTSAKNARHLDDTIGVESTRLEQRVYTCPKCKGWHVTKIATWVTKERTYVQSAPAPLPPARHIIPAGPQLAAIHQAAITAKFAKHSDLASHENGPDFTLTA